MKVLVIGPSPTRSKGGMATVIREIQEDQILNSQLEIDVFESFMDGRLLVRLVFSVWRYILFLISKRDYDIYHIHAASYGSIFRKGYYVRQAKKWNKKVMLHIHGASFMDFYSKLTDQKKQKVVDILKTADMVVALSKKWKQQFDSAFGLTNCVVLENGIDNEWLAEAITPAEEYKNNFVLLGRLGERKGAFDLVNAVELAAMQNPQIRLFMAGDGEIDKVKAMVAQKHLENNIEVVGWVNADGKLDLLKKVSTVVLPSYHEGLPMSVLEGMAAGKAIISTTVGAIPEVVAEENGILIQAGDVQALANAMLQCSTNAAMLEAMGRVNVKKIDEQFSMKHMHRKLLQYYEQVARDE